MVRTVVEATRQEKIPRVREDAGDNAEPDLRETTSRNPLSSKQILCQYEKNNSQIGRIARLDMRKQLSISEHRPVRVALIWHALESGVPVGARSGVETTLTRVADQRPRLTHLAINLIAGCAYPACRCQGQINPATASK